MNTYSRISYEGFQTVLQFQVFLYMVSNIQELALYLIPFVSYVPLEL